MNKILLFGLLVICLMGQTVTGDVIQSTISIHAGVEGFKPGATIPIALRIEMPEGWYTYAEDPGAAGMPPDIRFNAADEVDIGEWQFPEHETFTDAAGESYGFKNEVVLLNEITMPDDVPENVSFKGEFHVVWMICKDVCLPFQDRVTLELPKFSDGKDLVETDDWHELLLAGGWEKEEEQAD